MEMGKQHPAIIVIIAADPEDHQIGEIGIVSLRMDTSTYSALALPWAGHMHERLYRTVEKTGHLIIHGLIIDLLAAPPALYQAPRPELPEMMRYSRTRHINHGGEVYDTLLAVAEYPEDPQPALISKLAEDIRKRIEAFS